MSALVSRSPSVRRSPQAARRPARPSPRLADFDHPLVQETARRLTVGETTPRGRLARLFSFVRDDIQFEFPTEGDLVRASDVIRTGQGQCNTKSTLLLARCKAVGIPARIHYSLISKEIQHGFFIGVAYWLLPAQLSHSWIEVEIEGRWRMVDAYINDLPLHRGAVSELRRRGWRTGFSVALPDVGEPAPDLDVDVERFVQMGAVTEDHGTYDDPADYYATPRYRNRPGKVKLWLYGRMVRGINRRVQRLRQSPAVPSAGRRAGTPVAE